MNNAELVKILRNVAAALEIKGKNRFRITAYQKAADSIEHLTSEVKDIWEAKKLTSIPGIGSNIAQHIDELFRTGRVAHFEKVYAGLSPAIFELLLIPGLGPKRAYQLTKALSINQAKKAVSKLETEAKKGNVANLDGWGEKSEKELLSSIQLFRQGQIKENRMLLPFADRLAEELMEYMKSKVSIRRIDALGSLRRKVATIGDIDLAVATNDAQKVIKAFVSHPQVKKIIDQGDQGATVLLKVGRQVDLRVQKPQSYGAMLQYFTGSKHHNIRLREFALKKRLSLSEHGIKKTQKSLQSGGQAKLKSQKFSSEPKTLECKDEKEFYKILGMDWIPPELREDRGEIEAAISHKLPALLSLKDMKGDLHIHSDYNLNPSHDMGESSLESILNQAAGLGYEYVGIGDHNPKVSQQSASQISAILKKRKLTFEQKYTSWKKRVNKRVKLLIMLEVDIDTKGKIALPKEAEQYVDAYIVSIHSQFRMTKEDMTKRILSGLSHTKAKILGHPTGRILGKREQVQVDWSKIFSFCQKNKKALEINAAPERLDLSDTLVKEAIGKGVKLIINSDSHHVDNMHFLKYGVDVARRGWAEKKNILNTLGYNELVKWLKA